MGAEREFHLPFGREQISLRLAAELLAPRPSPHISDERKAIEAAIRHPIGSRPLEAIIHPGEQIAIIVNDVTRLCRTELMLPPIVDALSRAGISDDDIFIVFALGIHRSEERL